MDMLGALAHAADHAGLSDRLCVTNMHASDQRARRPGGGGDRGLVRLHVREPAFGELRLSSVGPGFRLVTAQNRWSEAWLAKDHPLEYMLSRRQVPVNAWVLEDLATEQARCCAAAYRQSSGGLPPPDSPGVVTPAGPLPVTPLRESGSVAQIRANGTEWVVTRRDWFTTYRAVPPCRRQPCRGLDCAMQEGGGWLNVCTNQAIRSFEDHRFVLRLDAPPVTPRRGDFIDFYLDPATGRAVLIAAARRVGVAPYFFERL
jgi:hypothetical protein